MNRPSMKNSSRKRAWALFAAPAAALALVFGVIGCGDVQGAADTEASAAPTATSVTEDAAAPGGATGGTTGDSSSTTTTEGPVVTYSTAYTVTYDDTDLDDGWSNSSASFVTLADGSIRFDGAGATVSGDKVAISEQGTYVVTGALSDGQIVVDLEEKGVVKLVLDGADIACSTSAPIYVKNADKTVIVLAAGTQNSIADGASYTLEDTDSDEPNAAIFSKDDLTINGSGSLTVTANYNNGIASKDDLKIVSGSITVTAVNDGIKGRDCIGIKDGVITVDAGGDGLQANNDADADQGYIDIQGGILDITAGTDGIQAETTLLVGAGDLTLSTGGGSVVSSSDADSDWGDWGRDQQGGWPGSTTDTTDATTGDGTGAAADTTSTTAKGLKAGGAVFVEGGTIVIDSSDDSIHSNGAVRIDGGSMTLTSGDDGIHSDATLEINGGDLTITKSYEGIESAVITINDGSIHVVAADDGLNVAGGVDSSSINGRRGRADFTVNENNKLYINGGYVAVDAAGDGIDCNGRMLMTAGTLLVNGPTNDGNGALDYLGEFTVTGGYIVAAGSAGMAQAPSESSTQYSLMVNFDTVQTAGMLVHIQDESGADIVTFAPMKEFRSFVVSSPDIKEAGTYTVYVGGSSAGTATDGLYPEGTYTPGEEYATLTVSGVVTTYGSFGGMMPGGRGGTLPDGGTMPGGGTRPGGRGDTAPGGSALDTTSTTAVTF